MRRRGRPAQGLGHVDQLEGGEETKHRLRVILASLAGELTVEQACRELGLGEARFHVLRRQALESALAGLTPKRRGRPAQHEPEIDRRVSELQSQVDELELALYASRVREELALSMPHLLRREGTGRSSAKKKESAPKKKRRSGRRR